MLKATGLEKRFGTVAALAGLDLAINAGEFFALLGGSGSGKSTLLRVMNRLIEPDQGDILLDGRSVLKDNPDELRQRIGMVFQQFNLFPHKTVVENVMTGPVRAKGMARKEARDIAEALLAKVGLSAKLDELPANLSGGQQQRVAIARALAMQPKVMLFDEVTSALDPELVGEVLRVIRDLANEGMTMILVTHEMHFARDVGDKLMFFDQGRILQQGAPKDVLDHPDSERLKTFLRRFSAANYL